MITVLTFIHFIDCVLLVAVVLLQKSKGDGLSGAFGGGGIAHFAHVGGALIGYLLMLYFQKNQFKRWD